MTSTNKGEGKTMTKFILLFATLISGFAFASAGPASNISDKYDATQITGKDYGSYFDWGMGQNGWGYCYQWTYSGQVLNQGRPVSNMNCEYNSPSNFNWGRAHDGFGYCYQWTPHGVAMNEGQPQSNYSCEQYSPSYYAWGNGQNGYTYCYQWGNGLALNRGQPVSNYYCQ